MTTTVSFSTTCVCTVILSFDSSLPSFFAFRRSRWTASITSACWARKALPRLVVQVMSSPSRLRRSGIVAVAWTLGSQGCACTAFSSSSPFSLAFLASHCWAWMISSG